VYEFNARGEALGITATVESYGYGNFINVDFEVTESTSGLPTDDLTQVTTLSNDGKVTKGSFSVGGAESHTNIKIRAFVVEDPTGIYDGDTLVLTLTNANFANDTKEWRQIRLGRDHSIAIAVDAEGTTNRDRGIWTWGRNQGLQLGYETPNYPAGGTSPITVGDSNGSSEIMPKPAKVPITLGDDDRWVQVSGGWAHSMALSEKGKLYVWGTITNYGLSGDSIGRPYGGNEHKILPGKTGLSQEDKFIIKHYDKPELIGENYRFIAAGHSSAFAIDNNGKLWAWGRNDDGRLGISTNMDASEKQEVTNAESGEDNDLQLEWTKIYAGESSTYGLKQDGSLWAWGSNKNQRLGITGGDQNSPVQISIRPSGERVIWRQVLAGSDHAVGLDSRGRIWSWGNTSQGRGGENNTGNAPKQAIDLTAGGNTQYGTAFTLIATHANGNTMALTNTGRIYLFGFNGYGQLGNGSQSGFSINPQDNKITIRGNGWQETNALNGFWLPADTLPDGERWVSIYTNGSSSMGISSASELWAWGHNQYGQLATGKYGKGFVTGDTFVPDSPKHVDVWQPVQNGAKPE